MRDRVGVRVGESVLERACASAITRKTEYNGRIINANEVEPGKFRFDEGTRCEGEKWNARGEREERRERERKEREKETYKENIYGARQGLIMLALEIRELFGQVATGMLRRRYRSERTVLAEKYPFAVVAACRFDFVILYLGE